MKHSRLEVRLTLQRRFIEGRCNQLSLQPPSSSSQLPTRCHVFFVIHTGGKTSTLCLLVVSQRARGLEVSETSGTKLFVSWQCHTTHFTLPRMSLLYACAAWNASPLSAALFIHLKFPRGEERLKACLDLEELPAYNLIVIV